MAQNYRRRGQDNTTLTLTLILVITIIANIFIFGTIKSDSTPADNTNLRTAPIETDIEEELPTKPKSDIPENYMAIELASDEIHFGELVVINNENAYVSEGSHAVVPYETPADVYTYKAKNYYILDTSIDLNPTVIDNLNSMFAEYVTHSGKADVMLNAAYRTTEVQAAILEEKGPEIAAQPGFSEHHTGYAFDICIYESGKSRTFADEGHFSWINENCKKYGFIRRYPEGKTEVTGIIFEPWHFRYVGVPHSYYIMSNGLVLEEYIELLKNYTATGTHLTVDADGKKYEVYYTPADEGVTKLYVPKDKNYEVSGNNIDGFVVTVDMSELPEENEAQKDVEIQVES